MHVFFSGIGGGSIGPLALIAKQAGYQVSGSDLKEGKNLNYLRAHGIADISIGQTKDQIAEIHARNPIDWFVYTAALPADHPELAFCRDNDIKTSKRDELVNKILIDKNLKLIAVSGTHGKGTTTAMVIWLFQKLGVPASYSLGAKTNFGEMSSYTPQSRYFIYECDEFDRNFLNFHPFFSIISGVGYDHHEIYPKEEDYFEAFRDFLEQSQRALLWEEDLKKLKLGEKDEKYTIANYDDQGINSIRLPGLYNRRDAWLAIKAVSQILGPRLDELIDFMNQFPGLSRRFERIAENLYSDDAHTPDKIKGCMSVAKELASQTGQKIVVIYEPLTNRRMHYLGADHHSVFEGTSAIYWLPSYLAREDPNLEVLSPTQLIKHLNPKLQGIAKPMERDDELKKNIDKHLQDRDMVVAMAGGGADSLDEWLRQHFTN